MDGQNGKKKINEDIDLERHLIQLQYGIIGSAPLIQQAVTRLLQVAPTDLSVLITGESGTGKELFARAIHDLSKRRLQKMVSINCAAIPETLLESELFGHEKGAFTGAVEQRKGFFEAAHRGTIFLDEIGEMSLGTQVKLLRVLESGEISRLGSSEIIKIDARIITATNRELDSEIMEGNFRRDLYFRLNAIQIHLPALREHIEDIPELVHYFAIRTCKKLGLNFSGITEDAIRLLQNLSWQGNVRELKNMIETSVTLEQGKQISVDILRAYIPRALPLGEHDSSNKQDALLYLPGRTVEQVERELILKALFELRTEVAQIKDILLSQNSSRNTQMWELPASHEDITNAGIVESKRENFRLDDVEKEKIMQAIHNFDGNRKHAAVALGISERTLYRKIKEYNIAE